MSEQNSHKESETVERSLQASFLMLASEVIRAVRSRPELREALSTICLYLADQFREGPSGEHADDARPSVNAGAGLHAEATSATAGPTREMTMRIAGVDVRVPARETPRVHEPPISISGPHVVREAPEGPSWRDERYDLGLVQRRALLKAEAARWAIERRRRAAEGADHQAQIKPTDVDLADRARNLPDCRLWMLDPYQSCPTEDVMECIAGCYETVALAAEIVRAIMSEDDEDAPLDELFHRVAEAQSALRAALLEADIKNDRDQYDLFHWLRQQTEEKRVLVHRHMRLDDPADWREWLDIQERLSALDEDRKAQQRRERERGQILSKVRFHLDKLSNAAPDERSAHWRKIDEALTAWVEAKWQPSNRDLVQMLYPILEDSTDDFDFSAPARLVLEAVDRYAASREMSESDEVGAVPARTAEVIAAANLLRDKVVVMIGGDVRPQSKRRIERELELRELRWVATKPHQEHASITPDVIRDDVDLVILNIRWTSHSYADFADVCRGSAKPFVRLPAGYNPSQIAHQVLEQVSEQLS